MGQKTGGFGKQGYCKLCSFEDPRVQDAFDKRCGLRKGKGYAYSPAALNEWLKEKGIDVRATRNTIYNHRIHVMHPKDRMVTAVQKRTIDHGTLPARVSNDEFLSTVIALGQQRAVSDPNEVTIDQALKATQIKANTKDRSNAQAMLVQIFTSGGTEPTIIEGEVKEV